METPANDIQPTLISGNLALRGQDLIYNQKKITLTEVSAIRFGWLPIRFEMYTIGGRYRVELKTHDQRIRLDFPYYLGILKKRQESKFETLMNAIWDNTIERLLITMKDDISNGKSVSVGKCAVNANGISYNDFLMRWEDLSYQKNYNRLTINSKSNTKVWTNLYYTEEDNVHVLMHYLEWRFEGDSNDPRDDI